MYYRGGLSDILEKPSPLSYSLYSYWFTGNRSLGKALKLLNIPYNDVKDPILIVINGVVFVDVKNEETFMLGRTIYKYEEFEGIQERRPEVKIDNKKIWDPRCLFTTIRLVLAQSKIVSKHETLGEKAREFKNNIPEVNKNDNIRNCLSTLEKEVWPNVLAIGYLCDFWSGYLQKTYGKSYLKLLDQITPMLVEEDWMYRSIKALTQFDAGEISLEELIEKYGNRANDDYELTCKRWSEISHDEWFSNEQKSTFSENITEDDTLAPHDEIDPKLLTLKDLLVLRSEARAKTLEHTAFLRKLLLKTYGEDRLPNLPLSKLYNSSAFNVYAVDPDDFIEEEILPLTEEIPSTGKGMGVSSGESKGKLKIVKSLDDKVEKDDICVFPDAGTYYSSLYGKCGGIIFLTGGVMSHGAIVAREYGIPAIIDLKCKGLNDELITSINGDTGEWVVE